MKVTVSIEIALPRERTVQLLADPAQMPKWLRGVVAHEPLDGVHGHVGTRSRVVFRMGRRRMECVETITRREPVDLRGIPSDRVVHFDREIVAEGMWHGARERLTEATPETTLWVSENEFRFDSRPMRWVAPLLRGVFRKQTRQHMRDFKAFAEQGTDVRSATTG